MTCQMQPLGGLKPTGKGTGFVFHGPQVSVAEPWHNKEFAARGQISRAGGPSHAGVLDQLDECLDSFPWLFFLGVENECKFSSLVC